MNNDQLMETLQSMFEISPLRNDGNNTNVYSSRIARRLLVLVFVEQCQEKINQIDRLTKLLPLIFRSNQVGHFGWFSRICEGVVDSFQCQSIGSNSRESSALFTRVVTNLSIITMDFIMWN